MRDNIVNNHQVKQNLYSLDEDDDVAAPILSKQMKFPASGSLLHHMPKPSISKLSISNALPLAKVVQNDAYTNNSCSPLLAWNKSLDQHALDTIEPGGFP